MQNNKTTNTSEKDKANSTDNELVSKIDDTKDWVYDAEYKRNVTAESYATNGKTYYAKDSNNAIEKVFEDAIKKYNEGVNDKITYIDECGYKKYINDNNLSIVLTYGVGGTDVIHIILT